MAELVDAPDLGSGAREGVGVRVSLLVHVNPDFYFQGFFIDIDILHTFV